MSPNTPSTLTDEDYAELALQLERCKQYEESVSHYEVQQQQQQQEPSTNLAHHFTTASQQHQPVLTSRPQLHPLMDDFGPALSYRNILSNNDSKRHQPDVYFPLATFQRLQQAERMNRGFTNATDGSASSVEAKEPDSLDSPPTSSYLSSNSYSAHQQPFHQARNHAGIQIEMPSNSAWQHHWQDPNHVYNIQNQSFHPHDPHSWNWQPPNATYPAYTSLAPSSHSAAYRLGESASLIHPQGLTAHNGQVTLQQTPPYDDAQQALQQYWPSNSFDGRTDNHSPPWDTDLFGGPLHSTAPAPFLSEPQTGIQQGMQIESRARSYQLPADHHSIFLSQSHQGHEQLTQHSQAHGPNISAHPGGVQPKTPQPARHSQVVHPSMPAYASKPPSERKQGRKPAVRKTPVKNSGIQKAPPRRKGQKFQTKRSSSPITPSKAIENQTQSTPVPMAPSNAIENETHITPVPMTSGNVIETQTQEIPIPTAPSNAIENQTQSTPVPMASSNVIENQIQSTPVPMTSSNVIEKQTQENPIPTAPHNAIEKQTQSTFVTMVASPEIEFYDAYGDEESEKNTALRDYLQDKASYPTTLPKRIEEDGKYGRVMTGRWLRPVI